ncbi:transportin, putative [Ixodes scapularis]|uniref:Transportin, putative n=1 Tax=Ixodes scapularis TaxID=6945 RepID=B7PP27_IXOSC|nr:transportin, putative [Ixodes scapularis]|eukprot:XP_002435519.1 transportin, putative [Ixodes scapularis]
MSPRQTPALQERRLASVAASSLLHICSTCRSQMVDHFGALLQVVAATDSLCVSTEAAVGLLKGTVLVLTQMSPDKITGGLRELCRIQLDPLTQAFCGPTFRLLGGADALRQHPDTVDDLFRLCTRFLQRAPLVFLKSTVLTGVLQCSLAACTLDHKEANASVMKFLFDLVHSGRSKQALGTWLENALKLLPTQSSGGAVTATPAQLSEFLATVTG